MNFENIIMKFNVKNNLEGWHFNFARGKVKSLKTTVLNGNLLHKNTGKKRNSKTKAENYPFLIFFPAVVLLFKFSNLWSQRQKPQ